MFCLTIWRAIKQQQSPMEQQWKRNEEIILWVDIIWATMQNCRMKTFHISRQAIFTWLTDLNADVETENEKWTANSPVSTYTNGNEREREKKKVICRQGAGLEAPNSRPPASHSLHRCVCSVSVRSQWHQNCPCFCQCKWESCFCPILSLWLREWTAQRESGPMVWPTAPSRTLPLLPAGMLWLGKSKNQHERENTFYVWQWLFNFLCNTKSNQARKLILNNLISFSCQRDLANAHKNALQEAIIAFEICHHVRLRLGLLW